MRIGVSLHLVVISIWLLVPAVAQAQYPFHVQPNLSVSTEYSYENESIYVSASVTAEPNPSYPWEYLAPYVPDAWYANLGVTGGSGLFSATPVSDEFHWDSVVEGCCVRMPDISIPMAEDVGPGPTSDPLQYEVQASVDFMFAR